VQWDPLHEPDQFIDVRKLLAKSGSPSRRNPMHSQHWHQLRSLTLQGHELSLDRGCPQRSTTIVPPASGRSGRISTSPQRPDAEQQAMLDDMPLTNCERIWGGMKARISVVHRRVGPRSGYAIQTRPQGASGGGRGCFGLDRVPNCAAIMKEALGFTSKKTLWGGPTSAHRVSRKGQEGCSGQHTHPLCSGSLTTTFDRVNRTSQNAEPLELGRRHACDFRLMVGAAGHTRIPV
jgi:hypothetical protein